VGTAAPQAVSEPPAGAGSGGADVVMVPSDEDSAPPPPALEPSLAVGTASMEEVMDMATS
jgi:hypothetical protein